MCAGGGNAFSGTMQATRGVLTVKMLFARFWRDESGATAIEYGLIGGLISVVIISAVTRVGTKISADFSKISSNL